MVPRALLILALLVLAFQLAKMACPHSRLERSAVPPPCVLVETGGQGVSCRDSNTDHPGDREWIEGGRQIRGRMHPDRIASLQIVIDLNRASASELQALPGVGPALAKRIVEARPFRAVSELDQVSGIGPKKFSGLRPLVVVHQNQNQNQDQDQD